MPANDLKITQIKLDNKNRVWAVGQDISYFDGDNWTYLNYQNSALPSNDPYYLDTRCLSIDADQSKWIGCANGPCISDVAVTKLYGQDNEKSESWTFTELGFTGGYYQCPVIEASPYGSEVLAFINSLNDGIGVTGTTGFIGATAGNLLIYNTEAREWRNILGEGNTIPRVYTIQPRGLDGFSYEYWIGTSNGIWILKDSYYQTENLYSESIYVPHVKVLTTENSGLPGNQIRAIEFDENGNVWIGTESGFCFYDFNEWQAWNSSSFTNLSSNLITTITVRPNGHIFFSAGEGELKQGTGLYHFNGSFLTNFDVSTGDLPNDNIISAELISQNTQNDNFRNYTNDLWISCYNDLVQFSYVIPHVRATSDYEGATGWDFVDYTNTDSLRLPKANKYTWDYPSWSGDDFDYLMRQHPGTDPRLLFVNSDLESIITGEVGNPNFYSAGPIPLSSQIQTAEGLTGSSFIVSATGGTAYITTSTTNNGNVIVGGYTNAAGVYLGYKNGSNYVQFANPNPTNAGSPVPAGSNLNAGFLAYYSKSGQPLGAIPFRGYSTKVLSVSSGFNDESIFVAGTFRRYLEVGKFVYNNVYPNAASLTTTGITGPTGGPIGLSSLYYPGITGPTFEYPWILNGATASVSGPFIPDPSLISNDAESLFVLEIDHNLGSSMSFGDINFGVTGGFERSYKVKNFRYFPIAASDFDATGVTGTFGYLNTESIHLDAGNKWVNVVLGVSGGYSTLANQWEFTNDLPNNNPFEFSSYSSGYLQSGSMIQLDRDLNLYDSFITAGTGNTHFNQSVQDSSSNTILVTGSTNQNFTFGSTGSTAANNLGHEPFFFVTDRNGTVTGKGIQIVKRGFYDDENYGVFAFSHEGLYSVATITEQNPNYSINQGSYSVTGGTSFYVQRFTPNGMIKKEFSYPINDSFAFLDESIITERDEYVLNMKQFGSTGTTGYYKAYKLSLSGTLNDTLDLTSNQIEVAGLSLAYDADSNLYYSITHSGATGATGIALPSSVSKIPSVFKIAQYNPPIGINYGNVDSRYGEGSCNWCDVHMNGSNFKIPLMSTVFMTNYPSDIYGKNMNTWRLLDSRSGDKILDVRKVPYFIYTFIKPGFYTLENSVEDANGNVYEITQNAFIEVVDHTAKKEDDPDPFVVNSSDYGYTVPKQTQEVKINDLSKDLLAEQMRILRQAGENLKGSPLLLKNDPDATFRPID